MLNKLMISAAIALTLSLPCARGLDVMLIQADGEEIAGELKEINAEGATVGAKKFPAKEIAQIKFSPSPAQFTPTAPAVILRNQDVLSQAVIVSGSDTKLTLKSGQEPLELEYKAIDAIVFYAASKTMPEGLAATLKAAPPTEDGLLLVKGETISGFYEKLSDKEISFNAGGQSKAYPFDQIAAIKFAATEKFEANKALNAVLRLVDGSRISVKPVEVSGVSLKVEVADGKKMQFTGSSIVSLEFSGGRMVYLSTLTPKTVEQKPYVGGAPVVFTWRKDRSAANGPLKIGDTVYEKGVGVHSYCKLVYELNGGYVKFMADVGMDASAPAKAVSAWKVIVDGKESAGGIAKAGGEKKAVAIDVTGAKTLELICDFGPDEDDAGDRLDFAKARLIKP